MTMGTLGMIFKDDSTLSLELSLKQHVHIYLLLQNGVIFDSHLIKECIRLCTE